MTFLAGDIGGTNVRLALAESASVPAGFEISHQQLFLSNSFDDFDSILRLFLQETLASPTAACFAVAGPVNHGRARVTNLPWELDEKDLSRQLGTAAVRLLNDFEAVGYGISGLGSEDLHILQTGEPLQGAKSACPFSQQMTFSPEAQ